MLITREEKNRQLWQIRHHRYFWQPGFGESFPSLTHPKPLSPEEQRAQYHRSRALQTAIRREARSLVKQMDKNADDENAKRKWQVFLNKNTLTDEQAREMYIDK